MPIRTSLPLLCLAVALAACGAKTEEKKPAGPPPTIVTTTQAKAITLEVTEDTLGSLEAVIDPTVRAEVAGRVVKVLTRPGDRVKAGETIALLDDRDFAIQSRADAAEIGRLQALLAQQERLVERQKNLVERGFISQNALDEAMSQRSALREQLASARAKADATRTDVGRTRVAAPVDGEVEVQIVAPGDYVKVGDPVIRMISNRRLRAHLPYPESIAHKMKRGLPVRIRSPQAPGAVVEGVIDDLRPTVTAGSRALDVIARFDNAGGLLAGGTVNASVVIESKAGTIVVPEQSVVLRPAGKVVYVLEGEQAKQRVVETGAKKDGMVEIVKGLQGGETVVLDGAGFLTDGARVSVRQPAGPPAKPATKA